MISRDLLEAIRDVAEEFMDCHHDHCPAGSDYPGHHFVEYELDPKGLERIRVLLEEEYDKEGREASQERAKEAHKDD